MPRPRRLRRRTPSRTRPGGAARRIHPHPPRAGSAGRTVPGGDSGRRPPRTARSLGHPRCPVRRGPAPSASGPGRAHGAASAVRGRPGTGGSRHRLPPAGHRRAGSAPVARARAAPGSAACSCRPAGRAPTPRARRRPRRPAPRELPRPVPGPRPAPRRARRRPWATVARRPRAGRRRRSSTSEPAVVIRSPASSWPARTLRRRARLVLRPAVDVEDVLRAAGPGRTEGDPSAFRRRRISLTVCGSSSVLRSVRAAPDQAASLDCPPAQRREPSPRCRRPRRPGPGRRTAPGRGRAR